MKSSLLLCVAAWAALAAGVCAQCPVTAIGPDGGARFAPPLTVVFGEVHATTHPITRVPIAWNLTQGDRPVCRFPAEGLDPLSASLLTTHADGGTTVFVATDGLGNLVACLPHDLALRLWLVVANYWWTPDRATLAACLSVLLFGGFGVVPVR
jgi:hypothetical protein